jgi:hypothetical protein
MERSETTENSKLHIQTSELSETALRLPQHDAASVSGCSAVDTRHASVAIGSNGIKSARSQMES